MEEIRIKMSSVWRELLIFGLMIVAAILTNVYAIRAYDGQWSELFNQLHIVLLLSVVYFIVLAVIRLVIYGIYRLVRKFTTKDVPNEMAS